MMLVCGLILVSSLQIISAQIPNVPQECLLPPPGVLRHPAACCNVPRLVEEKELEACGVHMNSRRAEPPSCENLHCLFTAHNATTNSGHVDEAKVIKFLDDWLAKNPNWSKAVAAGKQACLGRELPGPPQACDVQKLMFCVNDQFLRNCYNWEDSEDCKKIKEHADRCEKLIRP